VAKFEKDVVIVSCVKHNRKQTNLKDVRRIYQAFTHAR